MWEWVKNSTLGPTKFLLHLKKNTNTWNNFDFFLEFHPLTKLSLILWDNDRIWIKKKTCNKHSMKLEDYIRIVWRKKILSKDKRMKNGPLSVIIFIWRKPLPFLVVFLFPSSIFSQDNCGRIKSSLDFTVAVPFFSYENPGNTTNKSHLIHTKCSQG